MAKIETAKNKAKSDVLSWLLEPDNAAVRHFTLRDLCGPRESDPRLRDDQKVMLAQSVGFPKK